jgi:hypothetical protein
MHSDAEVDYLLALSANTVILGEREIARGLDPRVPADPARPAASGSRPSATALLPWRRFGYIRLHRLKAGIAQR